MQNGANARCRSALFMTSFAPGPVQDVNRLRQCQRNLAYRRDGVPPKARRYKSKKNWRDTGTCLMSAYRGGLPPSSGALRQPNQLAVDFNMIRTNPYICDQQWGKTETQNSATLEISIGFAMSPTSPSVRPILPPPVWKVAEGNYTVYARYTLALYSRRRNQPEQSYSFPPAFLRIALSVLPFSRRTNLDNASADKPTFAAICFSLNSPA